ncbi:MAG: hypothetical protein DRI34_02210 [Deltaproteobacteria bacterium]|nr:MAG: hypothetical protein DRI34_02210 [Deltaproteobacteria bacterium]
MTQAPEREEGTQAGQDWALIDVVRRALVAGAGALFMTEEGIRSFLGEMKLPKEAINFVLGQVARTKQDLFRVLGQELRGFLENIDLVEQARQLLSSLDVNIEATIRITPRQRPTGRSRSGSKKTVRSKSPATPGARGKKVASKS